MFSDRKDHLGIAEEVTVNDSEGARYGAIGNPEKYYLTWKKALGNGSGSATGPVIGTNNLLDQHLIQLCRKKRFLELVHDFIPAEGRQAKERRGLRGLYSHLQIQRGGARWRGAGLALRGLQHWSDPDLAGAHRPVVRGQNPGPHRHRPGQRTA